jgi:hypothetical protein
VAAGFELPDGHNPDCGPVGEILLAPIEEATRSPALFWRDHRQPVWLKRLIRSIASNFD